MDFGTGKTTGLNDLSLPGWTSLPAIYRDGAIHYFCNGEESDKTPDHGAYSLKIPIL